MPFVTRRFLSAILGLGLAGCGGPAACTVTGNVALDKKPFANANVAWNPSNGPLSAAVTDNDGNYKLENCIVGEGTFTIIPPITEDPATKAKATREKLVSQAQPPEPPVKKTGKKKKGPPVPLAPILPVEYHNIGTSPLKDTLVRGANVKNFDVPATVVE